MAEKYDIVGCVHGKGLNLGIDIVEPGTRTKCPKDALKIVYRAYDEGVVMDHHRGIDPAIPAAAGHHARAA